MKLYGFDFVGTYLGYMDGNGDFFDAEGRLRARLVGSRTLCDLEDRYRGHIDAQGSLFDEHDACWGYLRGWAGAVDRRDESRSPTAGFCPDPATLTQLRAVDVVHA